MSLPCVRGGGLLSEGLPRQQDGGIVEPTARNEGSLRSHSTPCFNLSRSSLSMRSTTAFRPS